MSNFDNGFAVGYILGKKKGGGGGPCPPCPEPEPNPTYILRSEYNNTYFTNMVSNAPVKPTSTFSYVVEDI